MFNNNRSESIAPSKGDDKVRNIKEELAILGGIKAQYELDIAEGKKLASTYHDLDKQVIIKQAELEQLENDTSEYSDKLKKYKSLEKSIADQNKVIDKLNIKTRDLLDFEKDLIDSITTLKELGNKEETELKSAILALEDKLSKSKNEYVVFERDAIKKVDEYNATLTEIKESIETSTTEIIDLRVEYSGLNHKYKVTSSQLESLNIAIEEATAKLATETERANAKYDERMAEFEEFKNSEVVRLQEREGEVSNRAKFLDVRENFLKDVKAQLEDKLGKKIDNLVF